MWYRSLYAPRTGGAYDSHHRTAGIAGRIWQRGCHVAARGARAAARADAKHRRDHEHGCGRRTGSPLEWAEWRAFQTRGGAVMRSAISALAGFALAGSFAFAQPSEGHLKIIHETATLRVAYRADSRPFSYVDAQGRPV